MKICICTIPIRSYPTDCPPFGAMAVIQSLRKIGENPKLLNIDYFRYGHREVEAYFKEHQFDVVGISAVVSTAYAYTKFLGNLIRRVSPGTTVIVGGNLAASAEILLRRCDVDFCVIGDGEYTIQDLVRILSEKPVKVDRLQDVKGIAFLDEQKKFCFTGNGRRPSAEEIESPDYGILEADGSLSYYISDEVADRMFGLRGVAEPGKRVATVVMAKGCVSRCTFCHRFEKGYRVRPIEKTIGHLSELIRQYNVGYVLVGDENFGSDRKATEELVRRMGELHLKWMAAGVRVRTVSRETLQHWKANGCVGVIFGIESGSSKILEIMEKNATREENLGALKSAYEAGLDTIVQLVIGMPGETDETIQETIEFLKEVSPYVREWEGTLPSEMISINYAQALPGTPLYEYAREQGAIGTDIDAEERYLIRISDIDAYRTDHFVNLTGWPLLKVLAWRQRILAHLDAHHCRTQLGGGSTSLPLRKIVAYYTGVAGYMLYQLVRKKPKPHWGGAQQKANAHIRDSGFFNVRFGVKYAPLLLNPVTRRLFGTAVTGVILLRNGNKPMFLVHLVWERLLWMFGIGRALSDVPGQSLRKIVRMDSSDDMRLLRMGR
ncbi:MAG: radical SAM protein [Pseudomonadota bacterium]